MSFWIIIEAVAAVVFVALLCWAVYHARHPGRRRRKPEHLAAKGNTAPDTLEALKKSLGTMDVILVILGIFLFLFVVTMIVLFALFQSTPDALIVAVFGFCGFECGAMAAIQRKKTEIKRKLEETEGKAPPNESEEQTP